MSRRPAKTGETLTSTDDESQIPEPPDPLDTSKPRISARALIRALTKYSASDLHLKAGRPPLYRIHGKLVPAKMQLFTAEQVQEIVYSLLSHKQIAELERKRHIDFSFMDREQGRFRANVYFQKGTVSAAIRGIPMVVPSIDVIGVPSVLRQLCHRQRGLILITGATGSGKSTTMAAMLQHINENRYVHIVSAEDPIEFVYRDVKASITQREVGSDITSFHEALHAGLRQDPDVIMIGEMRDRETIQAALTAAETGHLVISTLHTNDAKSTIDRILDVFPGDAQNQIRIQLAASLVAVISQQLLTKADGTGVVPACEVLIKSPVIETYLRKDERERIPEAMANSNAYYQMQTMNMALEKLVKTGTITAEEAIKHSPNPDDLRLILAGITREEGYMHKAG